MHLLYYRLPFAVAGTHVHVEGDLPHAPTCPYPDQAKPITRAGEKRMSLIEKFPGHFHDGFTHVPAFYFFCIPQHPFTLSSLPNSLYIQLSCLLVAHANNNATATQIQAVTEDASLYCLYRCCCGRSSLLCTRTNVSASWSLPAGK